MRLYEIAAILQPELDGAPLAELTEKIEGWISSYGSIVQTDHWGKRRMAYEINKHREGHYMFWYAEMDGEGVSDIERRMGYDEDIIRFLTIRRDALPEGSSRPASDDDEAEDAAEATPEAATEAAAAPAEEAAAAADVAEEAAPAEAAAAVEAVAEEAEAAAPAEEVVAEVVEAAPAEEAAAAVEAVAEEAAPAEEAGAAVEEAAEAAVAADDGAEDDLTKLEGVGPKIAELLKMDGIKTFQAVSEAGADRLKEVLASAGSRYRMHDPTTWPEQAALAAAGNWDALQELQDNLKGGRS